MGTVHADLIDADELHRPTQYQQSADPGAVGAFKWWLDTDTTVAYVRNATDTAWVVLGGGAGAHTHAASETSDFAEAVDDRVATLVAAGVGLTATYNDAGNVLTIDNDFAVTTLSFLIDGGGSAITTGIKGDLGPFDWAGTVEAWTVLADQTGSIVVDVWKAAYSAFPPVVGGSITGAEKPTISAGVKGQDTSLAGGAGWPIAVGDIWRFSVDSATAIQRLTLSFKVRRT